MFRFFKAVPRAVRQQWNVSVRPAPQSIHCEDDPDGTNKTTLVPISYLPYNRRWNVQGRSEKDDRRQDSGRRTQPNSTWALPNCQHGFLEAVGWGGAILLGLQLSKLYHLRTREEKRRTQQDEDDSCPVRWLHRIAQTTDGAPSCTSYISSSTTPPTSSDQNYSHTNEIPHTRLVENGGDNEGLDYESLLDIEVRSQQLYRSRLQCDSEVCSVTNLRDQDASTTSVQLQEAADPGGAPTDVTLEEVMVEWRKLSARYTAMVHHQLAFSALHRGATSEAFAQWQLACHQGDPKAHFNLALCYELGKGVAQDLFKAVDHYAIAAAGGHHMAMYNLAVYYLDGRGGVECDRSVAIGLLERAAAEGLKEAQTDLGVLMTERGGDWTHAAELFTSAAQKDDASAQYYLGMCYENGWGVQQDQKRAVEFYASAAATGHGPALHALGVFTEHGRGGMVMDLHEACDLYRRASHAGHNTAVADCKRITTQINQERFESEVQATRSIQGLAPTSRRCKSSPVLSHTKFSFHIRDNLLDFGLGDLDSPVMSPSPTPDAKVTFHIGDTSGEVTLPPDPGGRFQLGAGGFGDAMINEVPDVLVHNAKRGKLKGTFGGFDPHAYCNRNDLGYLLEREKRTDMRAVVKV